jgi:hypothetical protein
VGVGGDGEHLNPQFLQLFVFVGQIAQLGGADEGEIGRVKEEHGPLALDIGFADLDELARLECSCFERFDCAIDDTHLCISQA